MIHWMIQTNKIFISVKNIQIELLFKRVLYSNLYFNHINLYFQIGLVAFYQIFDFNNFDHEIQYHQCSESIANRLKNIFSYDTAPVKFLTTTHLIPRDNYWFKTSNVGVKIVSQGFF